MRAATLTLLSLACAILLASCSRSDGYSQDTPDDVIKTARLMVEHGQAGRLTTLVYSENEDWQRLLRRLGVLMGNLQELGTTINAKFPKEVAALKAQAEEAAKKGQAPGLLQQFTGQRSGLPRRNRIPSPEDQKRQQEALTSAIRRLFADPYAFLEEGAGHLTTQMVSDDVAAVLWDNQPVLPPMGLTMKRDTVKGKERWFFVLPTNLPLLANYMPRSKDEFKVFGSLVATLDNVVLDLTKDIKGGQLKSLDQVSSRAGEKALIPAAMVMYAYSKAVEARKKPAAKPAPGPG